jgi:hypothetical protein
VVATSLSEQQAVGWDLCFHGYFSHHWAFAVAVCPLLPSNDLHSRLHLILGNPGLARQFPSCGILPVYVAPPECFSSQFHSSQLSPDEGCAIDANITALYEQVDSYDCVYANIIAQSFGFKGLTEFSQLPGKQSILLIMATYICYASLK